MKRKLYIELTLSGLLDVGCAVDADGGLMAQDFELGSVGLTSWNGRKTTNVLATLSDLTTEGLQAVFAGVIEDWEAKLGSISARLQAQEEMG